jgi:hypothetical protein
MRRSLIAIVALASAGLWIAAANAQERRPVQRQPAGQPTARPAPRPTQPIARPAPRPHTSGTVRPQGATTGRPVTRPNPAVLPPRPVQPAVTPRPVQPVAPGVIARPVQPVVIGRPTRPVIVRPTRPSVVVTRPVTVVNRPIYRPVYRPVRWGAVVRVLPPRPRVVVIAGLSYYVADGVYYRTGVLPGEYVVVRPPIGVRVSHLPSDAITIEIDRRSYYYYDDVWYNDDMEVVVTPVGGYIHTLPDDYEVVQYVDDVYYRVGEHYYRPGWHEGRSAYFRVELRF